jgi:hypothetical protein
MIAITEIPFILSLSGLNESVKKNTTHIRFTSQNVQDLYS